MADWLRLIVFLGTTWAPSSAFAADKAPTPKVVAEISSCRGITAQSERLHCYDKAAAAFDIAVAQREITVLDRQTVRQARRTLFGLEIPKLPLFDGIDEKGEQIESIDAVVTSATRNGHGKWIVQLLGGGTWIQIDSEALSLWPEAGSKVKIRRAALGSYMMRIEGQRGIRVKRLS